MAQRTRRTVEQARSAILDAAEAIVTAVGPDALRVKEVASRAGMAHPNVLHHFGSREGLLAALTVRTAQRSNDRVVEALGQALEASETGRVEALTRVLDAVDTDGQGRLLAWLVLSGRADSLEAPNLEPIARLIHGWRTAALGPADLDQTRRLILLATLALIGDAVVGDGMIEGLQLGEGAEGRAAFRAWLAEFLVAYVEGQPAVPTTSDRGG